MPGETRSVPQPPVGVPVVDLNPFADEALLDADGSSQIWLDAGPVFWIAPLGVWGVARYNEVSAVLRDAATYCSGGGVGIDDIRITERGRPPSALLEADAPDHTRNRGIVNKVLAPRAMQQHFDVWAQEADELVRALVAKGEFDAAEELAAVYGNSIVPKEIGLKEHRPDLLYAFGLAGGNAQYPYSARAAATMNDPKVGEALQWINGQCERDQLAPGGWGEALLNAGDEGHCPVPVAKLLVRSLIFAGVENTVLVIGSMIRAFARFPDQWEALKADRGLIRGAIEEVMRLEGATVQLFRTTTREVEIAGVTLPEGAKLLMLMGAANRDPRRWPDPLRFDITRPQRANLGFGAGPHQCAGQVAARQELQVVLEALLKYVDRFELAGEPEQELNNTSRGFSHVPLRILARTEAALASAQ